MHSLDRQAIYWQERARRLYQEARWGACDDGNFSRTKQRQAAHCAGIARAMLGVDG